MNVQIFWSGDENRAPASFSEAVRGQLVSITPACCCAADDDTALAHHILVSYDICML